MINSKKEGNVLKNCLIVFNPPNYYVQYLFNALEK